MNHRKISSEVEIQRGIFMEDVCSPLIFVRVIMLLNYILRRCTGDDKFTKSQEKINQFFYKDDIKLFAKNGKELETFIQTMRIYS